MQNVTDKWMERVWKQTAETVFYHLFSTGFLAELWRTVEEKGISIDSTG